jgi:hypothetical protein
LSDFERHALSDIFISYTIEDLDRINPLVKALEEVG